MRVYIAGPMTGIPEFNYPAFNNAAELLTSFGYEVFNPATAERLNPTPGTPQPWDWYMRHALKMVASADGIALLPGWENSRGAVLEHHVGSALSLDIRPVDDWMLEASA